MGGSVQLVPYDHCILAASKLDIGFICRCDGAAVETH